MAEPGPATRIRTAEISARERYQLLTSLVVPRPIGWISTLSAAGQPNIAPFSYFMAVSPTPFLVAASIGHRAGQPKDTLRNILDTRAFCVNVVTERHFETMNLTSGEYGPEVDEFAAAGLAASMSDVVPAPFVADCPAVLECRLHEVVELQNSPNTLIIGEVLGVRISAKLPFVPGTLAVDPAALRPIGRLWGATYMMPGEIRTLPRPRVE